MYWYRLQIYIYIYIYIHIRKYYPVVAKQRLGKKEKENLPKADIQMLGINIIAAKDTLTTVEELLGASFSMRAVSYLGK
jgi:hypothetical protein